MPETNPPLRLPDAKTSQTFTFIDLFAGIGGIRLAFDAAGGKCVFTSEWDPKAQATYKLNFGAEPIFGDITTIDPSTIPDHDVLVGGFPCQPFSIAGVSKKTSMGLDHGFLDKTQGTLFFSLAQIIAAKRPKAFFLENVKNITTHDNGNTFRVIREVLTDLGYSFQFKVVNGDSYVPQRRERTYMVGFDTRGNAFCPQFTFPEYPSSPKPALRSILEKRVADKYTLTDNLWLYLQNYAKKHREAGNGFGYGIADRGGSTRTLSARYYKDGSEILLEQKNKNPRRLTPRECARLQGFPDTFQLNGSDSAMYKQFGNSVVVPAVRAVADAMEPFVVAMKEFEIFFAPNPYTGTKGDERPE